MLCLRTCSDVVIKRTFRPVCCVSAVVVAFFPCHHSTSIGLVIARVWFVCVSECALLMLCYGPCVRVRMYKCINKCICIYMYGSSDCIHVALWIAELNCMESVLPRFSEQLFRNVSMYGCAPHSHRSTKQYLLFVILAILLAPVLVNAL